MTFNLLGDYELLIDHLLDGDRSIKAKVAEADENDRGGLASLKYHLGRAKVTIPEHLRQIMRSCELDQENYEEHARDDFKKIEKRGSGKFRVTVQVEHNRFRKTFERIQDARNWRDRMELLSEVVDLENRQMD